jgi:hypothetical protein
LRTYIQNNSVKRIRYGSSTSFYYKYYLPVSYESGRFGALRSDSTHHFFRNACTKSGSLWFSQFSGSWLILSVYILMSFDFPFVRVYVINFRKLINVYILAYPEYRSFSWVFPVTDVWSVHRDLLPAFRYQ